MWKTKEEKEENSVKPFAIFKIGTHISSGGTTANFSEHDLEKSAKAYDPSLHEAPLVVGHPKDNSPSYGWVDSVSFSCGILTATPKQVDPVFSEAVKAGRYKKRSASFYLPDSPNNPKPGVLYLRHVGFVAIPAVKGLPDPEFKEQEEGVITFCECEQESDVMPDEENPNSLDFEEEKRKLDDRAKTLEFQEKQFKTLKELNPLVQKGQLSDAEAGCFSGILAHLGSGETFEVQFGEGEEQQDASAFLLTFLKGLPTRIEFGEIVKGNKPPQIDNKKVVDRAREIRGEASKNGLSMNFTEAVERARQELGVIEV